jgi:hypothetical protein
MKVLLAIDSINTLDILISEMSALMALSDRSPCAFDH